MHLKKYRQYSYTVHLLLTCVSDTTQMVQAKGLLFCYVTRERDRESLPSAQHYIAGIPMLEQQLTDAPPPNSPYANFLILQRQLRAKNKYIYIFWPRETRKHLTASSNNHNFLPRKHRASFMSNIEMGGTRILHRQEERHIEQANATLNLRVSFALTSLKSIRCSITCQCLQMNCDLMAPTKR